MMIRNPISVECPSCHQKYKVTPSSEIRRYKCKQCNSTIFVKPLDSIEKDDGKINENIFNKNISGKTIALVFMVLSIIFIIILINIEKSKSHNQLNTITTTNQNISDHKLIIQSGKLNEHISDIGGKEVYLYKKNGTLDDRPNDLEELCKDYVFYRNKILEYAKSGQNSSADKSRIKFEEINLWINEYNETDIKTMFSHLGLN